MIASSHNLPILSALQPRLRRQQARPARLVAGLLRAPARQGRARGLNSPGERAQHGHGGGDLQARCAPTPGQCSCCAAAACMHGTGGDMQLLKLMSMVEPQLIV